MKEWKTIVIVVVVALLVAAVVYMIYDKNRTETTPEEIALSNLQKRIGQLKVLKEEQALTRDVMLIQQEIKELNLKAQAKPVIEGEFIPIDKLPEEMKE